MSPPKVSVPGVVLAGGRSSRMGRPKALLPAGPDSFVGRIVRTLRAGGVREVVVVAPADDLAARIRAALAPHAPPSRVVVNPDPDRGQLSSLLVGLDAVDGPGAAAGRPAADTRPVDALLVTLVDVPLVSAATVRALLDHYRRTRAPIVRPARSAGSRLRSAGSRLRSAGSGLRSAGSGLRSAGSGLRSAGSGPSDASAYPPSAGSGQRSAAADPRSAGSRPGRRVGRHGHPVIFDRTLFAELRCADPAAGAKPVVRAHEAQAADVIVDDPGAFTDVDTPEDYLRAFGVPPPGVGHSQARASRKRATPTGR